MGRHRKKRKEKHEEDTMDGWRGQEGRFKSSDPPAAHRAALMCDAEIVHKCAHLMTILKSV